MLPLVLKGEEAAREFTPRPCGALCCLRPRPATAETAARQLRGTGLTAQARNAWTHRAAWRGIL